MTDEPSAPRTIPSPAPTLRLWPVWVILAVGATTALGVILWPHRSQQHVVMALGQVILGVIAALILWLLLGSRIPWRRRFLLLGYVVGSLGALGATFRIRGVTGNLVPILELRWARRVVESPVAPSATPAPPPRPQSSSFPQFLGPDRNGILPGPPPATNWATTPPVPLWRHPVGAAWSGFAIRDGRAVTQEQRGDTEWVVCYDLLTGTPLWSHFTPARYFTTLAGEGPRATPTLTRQRAVAMGGTGVLVVLDLETGRQLWSRDVIASNRVDVPGWGVSSSPLVLGNTVIVNGGGRGHALEAFQLEDGSPLWAGGNEGDTYSSPLPVTLDGVPQIVLFSGRLVGHDASTGQELWRFPWPGGHPHIAMPVVASATDLIVSSGYGTGSGRVRIQHGTGTNAWTAVPVWKVNRLKAKFTNPVLFQGHVYGLDDGILASLDAESGDLRWKDGRYGHGQTLLVGGRLVVMAESGEVILVDPSPKELRELARFPALSGKTWNPPALAGEYLVVRNDKEAACYRIPLDR